MKYTVGIVSRSLLCVSFIISGLMSCQGQEIVVKNDKKVVKSSDPQKPRIERKQVQKNDDSDPLFEEDVYEYKNKSRRFRKVQLTFAKLIHKSPEAPVYSPDGKKIAFAKTEKTKRGVKQMIWTMDKNGSNKRRITADLTRDNVYHRNPIWSHDGNRIIYIKKRNNSKKKNQYGGWDSFYNIEIVDLKNREVRKVFKKDSDQFLFTSLSVSPNGKEIAWSSSGSLWTINSDGTGIKRIAERKGGISLGGWSPDGKSIVYIQDSGSVGHKCHTDTHWQIKLVKIDGSNDRPFRDGFCATDVEWSRDGKHLFYTNNRLYKVGLDDNQTEQIYMDLYIPEVNMSPDEKCVVFSDEGPKLNDVYNIYRVCLEE